MARGDAPATVAATATDKGAARGAATGGATARNASEARSPGRRRLLDRFAVATLSSGVLLPAGLLVPAGLTLPNAARAAAAAARQPTPPQAEGPFYPRELPLDRDSDLTRVSGQPAFAKPAGATDPAAPLEARFDIVLAQDGRFSLFAPARLA